MRLGLGARFVALSVMAGSLALAPAVAYADDEYDGEEEAQTEEAPEAAPQPGADEDIEVDVDDSPVVAEAPAQAQPAPEPNMDDVLIPSKHAAKYGRRPLRTFQPVMDQGVEPYRRNSPGMMAAGITIITLGTLTAIGGIGAMASASAHDKDGWDYAYSSNAYFYRTPTEMDNDRTRRAGAVCVAVGLLSATAIGIPLTVVGARKIPLKPQMGSASPTLEASVGLTGGSMLVSF